MSKAMIEMTTSNSIKIKPLVRITRVMDVTFCDSNYVPPMIL